MRSRDRVVKAAVVGALLAGPCVNHAFAQRGAPATPARDATAVSTGSGTVRGRVVSADGAVPLSGTLVSATVPGQRLPFTALTDEAGKYELTGLPPGRYPITASRPGYIRLAYGQTRPAQGGKPLVIVERQTIENVNFTLPRGGVIAGAVIDESGQPVIGAGVAALQRIYKNGRPSAAVVSLGTTISSLMLTNDLGEFRVYGLEPGIFYVGAQTITTVAGLERPNVMVYAPGVSSLPDAQQVGVGLSQTVSGVTIVMRQMKLATITGIALDRDQQPITAGIVSLRQKGVDVDLGGVVRSARVENRDGRFTFTDVPAGDYTIVASDRRVGSALFCSLARVSVNGTNISDVRLEPLSTLTVSGRIVNAPGVPASPSSIPKARGSILFDPVDEELSRFGELSAVLEIGADATFSGTVFAVAMKLEVRQLPPGWALKAVRHRGTDVTDSGIDFDSDRDVRDIEIELTNALTELAGIARDADGNPVDDYTVVVFAKDPARRTGSPRYFATARPDQNRSFAIRGLAVGDYLVAALPYVDVNLVEDPAFLETLVKDATSVTLREGAKTTIDVKISR